MRAWCAILISMSKAIRDVKKALFFTSCSHAGKFFLDSLLDGHPQILGFNPTSLSKTVMDEVKKAYTLSGADLEDEICSYMERVFHDNEWDSYVADEENKKESIPWFSRYKAVLHEMIDEKRRYSEKELLLLIYWSLYETLYGSYQSSTDPVFFIDVHDGGKEEPILKWLLALGFDVTLIEAIRNPIIKLGSFFRMWQTEKIRPENLFRQLRYLGHETLNKTEQKQPILRYRFEDLKVHPEALLSMLCDRLEIGWDDCLMEATFLGKSSTFSSKNGEKTKGFSLKQVWYPYDEYFNAYDRFRLDLLFRERCRSYDYSYIPPESYPFSEAEMIKLFEQPFKFEEQLFFESEEERQKYRKDFRNLAEELVDMYHHKEDYPDCFCFGEYLKVKG